MITVVIPALNEEKTVASVVTLAKENPDVSEVIVVDDKSFDKTIEKAKEAEKKYNDTAKDSDKKN